VLELFISWVQSGFDVNLRRRLVCWLPFVKEVSYPLGVFGFPLTYRDRGVNSAVSLTDGLDGSDHAGGHGRLSAGCFRAYVAGSSVYSNTCCSPHIQLRRAADFVPRWRGRPGVFGFNTHPARSSWVTSGAGVGRCAPGTIAVIVRQGNRTDHHGRDNGRALSVMLQVTWFKYTKRYGTGLRLLKCSACITTLKKRLETQVVVRSGSSPCCFAWSACPFEAAVTTR
jgi:phospho-N-acetylmuramoyl-pentapeptide-transferase